MRICLDWISRAHAHALEVYVSGIDSLSHDRDWSDVPMHVLADDPARGAQLRGGTGGRRAPDGGHACVKVSLSEH
jgi:hypothetical protein